MFVVLLLPCVFRWRFAYVFCIFGGFFMPENAWQKFLGLVLKSLFGANFCFCCLVAALCFFRWCFAYVFAYLLGFSLPRMLGKNSLLLRFGFEIPFRERTLVFVVLLRPSVFRWCFAYVLAYLLGLVVPENSDEIPLEASESLAHSEAPTPHCALFSSLVVSLVVCLVICLSVGSGLPLGPIKGP